MPSESSKFGRNTACVAIGRIVASESYVIASAGCGARVVVVAEVRLLVGGFVLAGHQSEYLGTGGAGAGPRTVNHLRYNVFHVPSRRMRSSVPLTNRTKPVFSRLIPMP